MINDSVSSAEINKAVRSIKGRVEAYNGTTLTNTFSCNDKLVSFTIERVGDSGKFFGYGICQKLNAKIIDKEREIDLGTNHYLEAVFGAGAHYGYYFPKFNITEINRDETTNELSITAYDPLYKATEHKVKELNLSAYTIKEFVLAIATFLGLPLSIDSAAASSFATNYPSGANFSGEESLREALDAAAEATQTIYYINNNWELVFKRVLLKGSSDLAITKAKYFSMDCKDNRRVKGVCHVTELGDNVKAQSSITGTIQYVRNNPFWELRNDIATLVTNAKNVVSGFTLTQFSCEWRGNFLAEIGDQIALKTKDDATKHSFLLNDTITYDGTLSEKTEWEYSADDAETEAAPTSLGDAIKQTYARVDKANREIELLASEVQGNTTEIGRLLITTQNISAEVSRVEEEATTGIEQTNGAIKTVEEDVSSLKLNADSITASVSKIERTSSAALESLNDDVTALSSKEEAQITAEDVTIAIEKEMSKGTEKVVTSTGYTFNEEGLTVSKSGSEMTTQITEDGMSVKKDGEETLVANHNGVDAVNLHATTYLIIGTNSRFEDFGNRTGCFWIGN